MKDELKRKYVPPSFRARLMDKWHQFTQANKPVQEYVENFDEFLINAASLTLKSKIKFFLDLEPDLKKICEPLC